MFGKMINVKKSVEGVLENNMRARDNDTTLYFAVLDYYHGLSKILGKDAFVKLMRLVHDAPPPESIRRCRQKFQAKGLYVGRVREAARRLD